MQSAIAAFLPAFNPTDHNLQPDAFQSYLNGAEGANNEVADAESTLTTATTDRRDAATAIQDKALRVRDLVASNVAWKKYLPAIDAAARLVRGTPVPAKAKAAPPAGAPAGPPKKARMGARSQQGFADIAKNFGKLLAAVGKVAGYAAAEGSGLRVQDLTAQRTAFGTLNQAATDAEADLGEKQRRRADYFDGENGVKAKMKAIKLAARSQYGSRSAQYAAVKGIGL